MKEQDELSAYIGALRTSRGSTQAEFAADAQVTQPMVSAWEAGKETPSAETLMRLAKLAKYPANVFFWERAGLDREEMLSASGKIMEERGAPAKSGEITRLWVYRMAARGMEKTGQRIIMPAERLPNPLSTIGITLDEGSSRFTLTPGDVIFVDSSRANPLDLPSFFGETVAMTFTGKLFVGRMQSPQVSGANGRLLRLETLDEALHREASLISEWNEYPDELRAPGYRPVPYQDVNLNDGWEMIGRVVAWSRKVSAKTDEKPQAPERAIPDVPEGPKKTVEICTDVKAMGEGKDRHFVRTFVEVSNESDLRPELLAKDFKRPVISRQDGMKVYVTADGKKLRFHPKTGALVGYK